MGGKLKKIIPLALLALVPLTALWTRADSAPELSFSWQSLLNGDFTNQLEVYVSQNLPFRLRLEQLSLDLRLAGGNREQNDIYIHRDALLKNVSPPISSYLEKNTTNLQAFSQYGAEMDSPVYFTLIPTASAITRQYLPLYAEPYPQRQAVDNIYSQLLGSAVTVDCFPVLINNQDQYLYYHTENNLTAIGGYYVYTTIASRMKIENATLEQFDISYLKNDYYGDLYYRSPYKNVQGDIFAAYHYSRYNREYTVTHIQADSRRTYHTLYPAHRLDGPRPLDVYLGGLSAVMEIRTTAPFERNLLVFGDKTALAYLPFLANHFRQVTFVDLSQTPDPSYEILLEDYDRVLVAYGVETYFSTDIPSRITRYMEESTWMIP